MLVPALNKKRAILTLGDRTHGLAFKRAIDHRVNLTAVAGRLFSAEFSLDTWLDQHNVPGAILNVDKEGNRGNLNGRRDPIYRVPEIALVSKAAQRNFLSVQETGLHSNDSPSIPAAILRTLGNTPALVLVGQSTAPGVIPLAFDRRYTLGRDPQNEIVLDDTSASRRHAEIFAAPDGFYVRDLDSRYGVFVNKVKVNNAYHLSHGDRIVLGDMLLYFSYARETLHVLLEGFVKVARHTGQRPGNERIIAYRQGETILPAVLTCWAMARR